MRVQWVHVFTVTVQQRLDSNYRFKPHMNPALSARLLTASRRIR